MTEKEKVLLGICPYDPADPELEQCRLEARRLARLYNQTIEGDTQARLAILKQLLGKCENDTYFEPDFHCDYGFNISIGKNFYANFGCVILDCAPVTIGDNAMFAPGVHIYAATHPIDSLKRCDLHIELNGKVTIGNNVWIGGRAVIIPNVTIGDNVVIAAGAVVTHDVPDNVMVAGVPAKIVKYIPLQEKRIC